MKITILTLFPEMFEGFLTTSIIKKAILKKLVEVECVNIRDFTKDKHARVDDYPFGGGAGLIMQAQPIMDAIESLKTSETKVIYLTPVAPVLTQQKVKSLINYTHIILLCGHYEGVDERVLTMVDEVISIGNYVLTGGELAAMVVSDAMIRLLDGVISEGSIDEESFEQDLLEYPQYTRPKEYKGLIVPEVLLSGHHTLIKQWRLEQSVLKTMQHRPDLLEKQSLSKEVLAIIKKINAQKCEKD